MYDVVITNQPTGETCTVANPAGTVGSANVTNVNVSCTASTPPVTYTIGGTIEGRATFVEALTEKLMMYAVNRQLDYFDMPQVRTIVRGAAKNNNTLSSIVLGIVDSDAFRKQGPPTKTLAAKN